MSKGTLPRRSKSFTRNDLLPPSRTSSPLGHTRVISSSGSRSRQSLVNGNNKVSSERDGDSRLSHDQSESWRSEQLFADDEIPNIAEASNSFRMEFFFFYMFLYNFRMPQCFVNSMIWCVLNQLWKCPWLQTAWERWRWASLFAESSYLTNFGLFIGVQTTTRYKSAPPPFLSPQTEYSFPEASRRLYHRRRGRKPPSSNTSRQQNISANLLSCYCLS